MAAATPVPAPAGVTEVRGADGGVSCTASDVSCAALPSSASAPATSPPRMPSRLPPSEMRPAAVVTPTEEDQTEEQVDDAFAAAFSGDDTYTGLFATLDSAPAPGDASASGAAAERGQVTGADAEL